MSGDPGCTPVAKQNQDYGLSRGKESPIENIGEFLDLSNLLSARAARAKALCLAIADCELDDAIFIMEGVLDQLRGGPPVAYFQNLPAEAEDWARFASRAELRAYAIVALAGMTPGGRAAVFHHFSITPAP